MGQLTIRELTAQLPAVGPETGLTRVDSLGPRGGRVSRFDLAPAVLRGLEAENLQLLDGTIRSVRTETTRVTGVTARSVELTGCDLGQLRWTGGTVSRTRFAGCKLLGARFENVTLDHVVFSDCKLDYAVLENIRAKGPVVFVRCSLREAGFRGCDLSRALLDDCQLPLTEFGPGRYQGCDLRGNDLSAVRGAHHLGRVIIDRIQVLQLGAALAGDIEVSFGDERPSPWPSG